MSTLKCFLQKKDLIQYFCRVYIIIEKRRKYTSKTKIDRNFYFCEKYIHNFWFIEIISDNKNFKILSNNCIGNIL